MEPILPTKRSVDYEETKSLKRAKLDPKSNIVYQPTRVLFIRGLSSSATDKEIVQICSQVGVIQQLFVLHNKGQAFVEFDSLQAANFCLHHFTVTPAYIDGNKLFFSYSGREQITRKPHEAPSPNKELLLTITEARFPVTVDVLAKIFMPYGRILKSRIFPRNVGYQCIVELQSLNAAQAARAALDGQYIYSGCNHIKAEYSPMPLLVQETSASVEVNEQEYSNVVFLHNMGQNATPDMLFNLFSLYGNVQRVKIFFKRRDMGLVQFEDHQQAMNAKTNLHNVPFLGCTLLVSISRNSFINMPNSERKAFFCKDYADSTFHRYKIAGSKNLQNMFPPSNIVHVSNLMESMDQGFFKGLFADQADLIGFKYIGEGKRMALVKFRNIADAVMVLVHHHNENISGRRGRKGKVLVCAASNSAVDNITQRIYQKTPLDVLRIKSRSFQSLESKTQHAYMLHYRVRKIMQSILKKGDQQCEQYKRVIEKKNLGLPLDIQQNKLYNNLKDYIQYQLIQSCDVVCVTLISSWSRRLKKHRFKFVLIDQATQAIQPQALLPVFLGVQQLALIGDHKQLGPVVLQTEDPTAVQRISLFQRMVKEKRPLVSLNIQYRMHPSIARFSNINFYHNLLKDGVTAQQRTSAFKIPWPNKNHPIAFVDFKSQEEPMGESKYNLNEASYVTKIYLQLRDLGVQADEIGIITMYTAQRIMIIQQLLENNVNREEINVASVDSFQGREKDFIIISCVRSNKRRFVGFLKIPERLNVAITRARFGLIIVGDCLTIKNDELWNSLINHFKKFKAVIKKYSSNFW